MAGYEAPGQSAPALPDCAWGGGHCCRPTGGKRAECLSSYSSLAAGENELQLKLSHFLGSETVKRMQALHKLSLYLGSLKGSPGVGSRPGLNSPQHFICPASPEREHFSGREGVPSPVLCTQTLLGCDVCLIFRFAFCLPQACL